MFCTRCGTDIGDSKFKRCEKCRADYRRWYMRHKFSECERMLTRYENLKAQGLCVTCGGKKAREGRTQCAECTARSVASNKAYRARKRQEG